MSRQDYFIKIRNYILLQNRIAELHYAIDDDEKKRPRLCIWCVFEFPSGRMTGEWVEFPRPTRQRVRWWLEGFLKVGGTF